MARSRANTPTPTKRSSTARPNAPQKRSANKPVGTAEFEAALERLNVRPPFALAVSGGADSLSLMLLAAGWCKRCRMPPPLALTVDHALRENSAAEAAQVASWARAVGVPHETLAWRGRKPARNIQADARNARYRLIGERMRESGIGALLTGHTEDDQAETFLLRLARGSGLDGLSGMAAVAAFPLPAFADLLLARPLLAFSHERLIATLVARRQDWIEDPSNANDRFVRVQIRALMPALSEAGLTRERIAAATNHLARAKHAIDASVAALIAEAVEIAPWGYALLKPQHFVRAPEEVALRALARLLEAFGGGDYPPRFEQTEQALAWLRAPKGSPSGRTLGGCRCARRPDGRVLLAREESALQKQGADTALRPGASVLWDRRFLVTLSKAPTDAAIQLRPLGPEGVKAAGKAAKLPPVEPHRIAAATPGLWLAERLVGAPLLEFAAPGWSISARFAGLPRG